MAVASLSPATLHFVREWFEERDAEFKTFPWNPNSPERNPVEYLWGVLEPQIRAAVASPRTSQHSKDLLLTSGSQKPQSTFRSLVDSDGSGRCVTRLGPAAY